METHSQALPGYFFMQQFLLKSQRGCWLNEQIHTHHFQQDLNEDGTLAMWGWASCSHTAPQAASCVARHFPVGMQ